MLLLNAARTAFVTERHLATLTTLRGDGTPHVVPVAFTWDADAAVARVTTRPTTQKAVNARRRVDGRPGRAVLCQVDGRRWLTLEGTVEVSDDPVEIAGALDRYAARYRTPDPTIERVVLRVAVDRVLSSRDLA
ncbi:TIGR03618 family F420-dependent PPOX class oxidoreductase [Cellulomonas pakistanensis]|uniref:PPOX class F420-dependent enzyme n=1 Tax=Cellulomonas pakistanensis TaxID=992287 RepID=A0A919U1I3_9CELL|nr:TIGR03618 family F420-dependent PPOX class oxidoreductase [Cellulomonas pakistanensis]GIG34913.1 PPOX class F420-dependent enzyme [Cellulomonas pakistanensis]